MEDRAQCDGGTSQISIKESGKKRISLSKFVATDSASSCLSLEKPIGFPDAEVSPQVHVVTSRTSFLIDGCAAQEFWSKVLRKFFFQLVRKLFYQH